jgi:hypothetical protein
MGELERRMEPNRFCGFLCLTDDYSLSKPLKAVGKGLRDIFTTLTSQSMPLLSLTPTFQVGVERTE